MDSIKDQCVLRHNITLVRDDEGDITGVAGSTTIEKLPDPLPGNICVVCAACDAKVKEMLEKSGWMKR